MRRPLNREVSNSAKLHAFFMSMREINYMRITKYIVYALAVLLLPILMVNFFPILWWAVLHIKIYMWFMIGILAFFLLRKIPFYAKNEEILQTHSHELTHAIVGIIFLQEILSIESEKNRGVVWHRGGKFGGIFISLAPYCFPVFVYAVILFRIIGANSQLYVFDILIGLILGFYLLCFWKDTRLEQSDLQRYGPVCSMIFILMMWFFHASLILLCIRKGFVNAITYLFQQYWGTLVNWWNLIF